MRQRIWISVGACVDVDTWNFDQRKHEKELQKRMEEVAKELIGGKDIVFDLEYDEPC